MRKAFPKHGNAYLAFGNIPCSGHGGKFKGYISFT
jgi:hypothetical protein